MNRYLLAGLSAVALCIPADIAFSQDLGCTVSASNLGFGSVGLLDVSVDSTGEIAVTCLLGLSYTVGLDDGQANVGPEGRRLSNGSATIAYNIFKDSARSEVWGQEGDASGPVPGTGSGSRQALITYGRIPAQNAPVPGTYTDLITVVLTY